MPPICPQRFELPGPAKALLQQALGSLPAPLWALEEPTFATVWRTLEAREGRPLLVQHKRSLGVVSLLFTGDEVRGGELLAREPAREACAAANDCPCRLGAALDTPSWEQALGVAGLDPPRPRVDGGAQRPYPLAAGSCCLAMAIDAEGGVLDARLDLRVRASDPLEAIARALTHAQRFPDADGRPCPFAVGMDGAALRHASFAERSLADWRLADADLVGVSFAQAELRRCELRRADLELADLSGARLDRCACEDIHAVVSSGEAARVEGGSFRRANLALSSWARSGWRGVDLREASFRDADLRGATFEGCDLRGACLAEADCAAARFLDCELELVDWRDARRPTTSSAGGSAR